jgi:hypothetical protein
MNHAIVVFCTQRPVPQLCRVLCARKSLLQLLVHATSSSGGFAINNTMHCTRSLVQTLCIDHESPREDSSSPLVSSAPARPSSKPCHDHWRCIIVHIAVAFRNAGAGELLKRNKRSKETGYRPRFVQIVSVLHSSALCLREHKSDTLDSIIVFLFPKTAHLIASYCFGLDCIEMHSTTLHCMKEGMHIYCCLSNTAPTMQAQQALSRMYSF